VSVKNKYSQAESGNVMVMAVMIMLVLMVLGTSILSIASMEKKISHNAVYTQKAQQAADAGVEWAIAQIYLNELRERTFYTDPNTIPAITGVNSRGTGDDSIQWNITSLQSPTVGLAPDTNQEISYDYRFLCTGIYKNISRSLNVRVSYPFTITRDLNNAEIFYREVNNTNYNNAQITDYIINN